MKNQILKISSNDNVAVALKSLNESDLVLVNNSKLTVKQPILPGHKIALTTIKKGERIIKYGFPIGVAMQDIPAGEWVHTHNLKTLLDAETEEYEYHPFHHEHFLSDESYRFDGFLRKNNLAGVRNEILIIPTVGCVNQLCTKLALEFNQKLLPANVDGVYAFSHQFGCSQLGDDHLNTQKILAGLVKHPNAGGVLVVGLGCENNTVESFQKILGDYSPERVRFLIAQDVEDEIARGSELLNELVNYATQFRRQTVPLSSLVVGLKCGGSDGFSGITANPLIGQVADKINEQGGTTILTEVPEMFGAEKILMQRCVNETIFQKCVHMINDFKNYYLRNQQPVYENPSPGNKQGGITTLEEKSLGCIQKGGTSPVVDVLAYGGQVRAKGLNLLSSPGNDPVSATALVAAGAQILLFSTGRGTPLGAPVPTLKIASNSILAKRKSNWIDFDAGRMLEHSQQIILREKLFNYIIMIASGKLLTKNEENGYRDIALFKDGVML